MWEGLSGGCRAGLTLKRWNQLAIFAIQLVDYIAAEVWLVEDGVHQVRLLRVPIWCRSGGGGTREAGGMSLSGGHAPVSDGGQLDHRRAKGVLNHCAEESKARTGRFLRGKLISDHGLFSSYEGQQGVCERARFLERFSWMHRALDGWMLELEASTAMDLDITVFFLCVTCGLEKLGRDEN